MLNIVLDEVTKLSEAWVEKADTLHAHGAEGNAKTVRLMLGELYQMYDRLKARVSRLTVAEYAAMNGVQPDTVRRWIRAGQLPASRAGDGSWSIPYGSVRRKKPVLRRVA
jgi:excisionase family DNA binding protein